MRFSAGYVRRSTDKQDQSIPDQKKAILEYAKQNHFKISEWFLDDGISGKAIKGREKFQEIIIFVEAGNGFLIENSHNSGMPG